MASIATTLINRLPARLRMFLTPVFMFVVAWLALTGLIETVRDNDHFVLLKLAALAVGCALGAAIRPVPPEYRGPAENVG